MKVNQPQRHHVSPGVVHGVTSQRSATKRFTEASLEANPFPKGCVDRQTRAVTRARSAASTRVRSAKTKTTARHERSLALGSTAASPLRPGACIRPPSSRRPHGRGGGSRRWPPRRRGRRSNRCRRRRRSP